MSQKLISIEEQSQQIVERVFVIEKLLSKIDISKLDQFEKDLNIVLNKMKDCEDSQEEAKMPEP